MSYFEIYKDIAGEYRFRLKAPNRMIIADSGGSYRTKAGAMEAIAQIKRITEKSNVLDQTSPESKREEKARETDNIEKAKKIVELMIGINAILRSKYKFSFFREDQPGIISSIHTPCSSIDNLTEKIAGMCALFEMKREDKEILKTLITSTENLGSIKLLNQLFEERGESYNPEMFECWYKLYDLRTNAPLHARTHEDILPVINFFGARTPLDYKQIWYGITDKFLKSLVECHDIIVGM